MSSNLKGKRARFVAEYLIDQNATQAAIRAGYSQKTARSQGQRLLTKADISKAIENGNRAKEIRTEITSDRILKELASIGFMTAEQLEEANAKQSDKIKALELMGKNLGMWTEKTESQVNGKLIVEWGDDGHEDQA